MNNDTNLTFFSNIIRPESLESIDLSSRSSSQDSNDVHCSTFNFKNILKKILFCF